VNPRDASWAKETALDIKAVGQDKLVFNIEMQVSGGSPWVQSLALEIIKGSSKRGSPQGGTALLGILSGRR